MKYTPRYRATTLTMGIFEVAAYVMMVLGFFVICISFVTGGLIYLAGGELTIWSRLVAALPGIGILIAGLYFLIFIQTSRATVDCAELTRELLFLLKQNGDADTSPRRRRRILSGLAKALRQA
jgi:hypothetical protein